MIALILADPDKDFDREIRWALKDNKDISVRAFATKLNQIEALVKEHAPCVLLIGPGWKEKPIADLAKDIREKTNTTIILSVNGSKPCNQKKAISADKPAIDFLTFPTQTDELISAIQRAYEILRETPASTGDKGKILTIFSTKGGVGKTVIATNLAVSLARDHGTSVVLLDLDLQFGDVGVMLKLNPEHTIYDAACVGENLDIEVLNGFLTSHDSGVRALLAPLQPELADLVSSKSVQQILNALRKSFDYIVVDTPPSFNDHVLTVLDETNQICLVATMDIPTLKNIKLCLQTLKLLGCPQEITKLIINRADDRIGLNLAEVEKALGIRVSACIPTDKKVPLSVSRGVPVVLDSPQAPFSKSLNRLKELFRSLNKMSDKRAPKKRPIRREAIA